MTLASPAQPDERPPQMANGRLVVAAGVAGIWLCLTALLWLALREQAPDRKAALLASTIMFLAAVTSHTAIAVHGWRAIGWFRWPVLIGVVLTCGVLSHLVLVRLGMLQSLMQDLVNMSAVSIIALAVNLAWSGHRARQSLVTEAALRARAESRLAEGRLRPSGLIGVKVGHGERMVDPGGISRIQADGNFTILHDRSGPIFVSEPMKTIVERLEPYGFVRVHKSHAVNAEAVRERRRDALVLNDGVVVAVGRTFRF